jgi:hypothetical protein
MTGLIRKFLDRLPCKHIGDGKGNDFFWRYKVLENRWFSVYLHRFFRSDADRCLHDHPWPFVSVILSGGYWEEIGCRVPDFLTVDSRPPFVVERRWRRPGSVLFRRASAAHRIVIDPEMRPWSLVVVGRKSRDWGFWERSGWKAWKPGASPICED